MSLDDQYFGYYEMSGSILNDKLSILALCIQGIMMILFIVLISFLLLPIAKSIPQTLFVVPINRLLKLLRSNAEPKSFSAPYEIMKLRHEVDAILQEKAEVTRKKELVKQANEHGGKDNISAMLAKPVKAYPANSNWLSKIVELFT